MIEVEAKFLVPDEETLMGSLRPHFDDATMTAYVQADEYFNHPCRDFNITDEALRIRKCNDRLEVTYKGPRLDQVTKTREELEVEIQNLCRPETELTLHSILRALGFRSVGIVRKQRRSYVTSIEGSLLTLSIDRVEGLPLYAELEITCDPLERDAATATILRLAERLALGQSERRSYLELLGFR